MKRYFSVLLFAGSAFWMAAAHAEDAKIRILLDGTYHADEVKGIEDKEDWTAIFPSGQRYVARDVKITVKTVQDPVLDDEKGPFTGKEISSAPGAVFLLQGLPVGNGCVLDSAPVNTDLLEEGKSAEIPGRLGKVRLVAEKGAGYRLVAKVGAKETLLVSSEGEMENWPHLIWGGDLNKDGYPDFLIDRSTNSNISIPALYLSKKEGGEISYWKAAEHLSTGC